MHRFVVILLFIQLPLFCFSQNPLRDYSEAIQSRFSKSQPEINYTVTVDKEDLSVVSVEIQIHNVADTFQLALYAHPESDDKYWRYIENLEAGTPNEKATVFREDSSLWRVVTHHHEAIVHYKLRLPQLIAFRNLRSAWRPFLSGTGGLIGDYHTFMFIVGQTLAPSHIHFQIPEGWQIATGLEPTADAYTYYASSAKMLLDAPVLIGHFKSWRFEVNGVPHTIAYWALPDASTFDTATLVSDIQKIVG